MSQLEFVTYEEAMEHSMVQNIATRDKIISMSGADSTAVIVFEKKGPVFLGRSLHLRRGPALFPEEDVKIVQVAVGHFATLLIDNRGRVWLATVGPPLEKNGVPVEKNGILDCFPLEELKKLGPTLLLSDKLVDIVQAAIGWNHAIFINRSGQVFLMGGPFSESEGQPKEHYITLDSIVQIPNLPPIKLGILTGLGAVLLDWEGRLWNNKIPFIKMNLDQGIIFKRFFETGPTFYQLSGSSSRSGFIALDISGQAWMVGYMGLRANTTMKKLEGLPTIKRVVMSGSYYLIDIYDRLWAFGSNEYGQLRYERDINTPEIISLPSQRVQGVSGTDNVTIVNYL